VWIVRGSSETEDFNINLDRLKGRIEPMTFTSGAGSDIFAEIDIIIDAILGSGL
jgi:NAD(P)H-hydrate repair Nnr-like enzyme with NAD(P)H-hydrate epimerase domain